MSTSTRGPETLLRALAHPRFLLTAWPWKGLAHTLSGLVFTVVLFTVAAPLYLPWILFFVVLITRPDSLGAITALVFAGGTVGVLFGPLVALPVGIVERWRLQLIHDDVPASGHRDPAAPGLGPWLHTRYSEGATWRELLYTGLTVLTHTVAGFMIANFALFALLLALAPFLVEETTQGMTLGPVTLHTTEEALPYTLLAPVCAVAALYLSGLFAGLQGLMARTLLTGPPREVLRAELNEVNDSRARLTSAFEYERRRIERDLHDGAQQKLIALQMDLGMARLDLEQDSEAERRVGTAQARAEELIDELRELVRGIHPRVLADRGLPAALGELADRCPVPVTVEADLPRRRPTHVESTAYFAVAEALTNVYKHTEATAATVHAFLREEDDGDVLVVEVTDFGPGGADPARGSGLTGMSDRIAVMGGTMELSSPEGGPTRIRVELPCTTEHPRT